LFHIQHPSEVGIYIGGLQAPGDPVLQVVVLALIDAGVVGRKLTYVLRIVIDQLQDLQALLILELLYG